MQMLIAVRSIARLDDCQIAEKPQTTKQPDNKTTKQQMQMLIAVRSIARSDDCQIAEKPQTTKQQNNQTTNTHFYRSFPMSRLKYLSVKRIF